jgi:hypothetical protein
VSARPSQRPLTIQALDALPVLIDVPTAARWLGTGSKKLRARFDGGHTAIVQVGDREVCIESLKLGGQRWVVTESLRQVFQARGP